jgi:predicted DNA-binding WGR domain protein
MGTRSFVLEGADKRFWDVSWDGPDVEITSGKWGKAGRARTETFTSATARDTFIAAEIAKVLKKGYVEIGEIAPAADAPTAATERAVASLRNRIEKTRRRAFLPTFVEGSAGMARVRGPMTLDAGEVWPACPVCSAPLSGLFELDAHALPEPSLREDALVQLFWCEAWEGRKGAEVCTARGGWLARRRARTGTLHPQPAHARAPRPFAIVDWTAVDEIAPSPPSELREALDEADPEVIRALLRSVNAADGEEDPYRAVAKALGLAARTSPKLGGWPVFVQEPPADVAAAHLLFQIEAAPPFDVNFGDVGAGQLVVDGRGALRFFWASH